MASSITGPNPCRFFLWGFIKSKVYAVDCHSEEEMSQRIITSFQAVTPAMLTNVTDSVLRRMRLCTEKGGSHIEPFL